MKQLLILLLLFILPFTINSQKMVDDSKGWDISLDGQVLMFKSDSSFLMSYNKVNEIKNKTENLKAQVNILIQIGGSQDLIIKKLRLRDSLHYLEIEQYEKMDSIMREKNHLSNSIINNYKILLISTEQKLREEEKEANKQRLWKNIYKISIPVVAIVTGIIILK